jgi:hypothetical protein
MVMERFHFVMPAAGELDFALGWLIAFRCQYLLFNSADTSQIT